MFKKAPDVRWQEQEKEIFFIYLNQNVFKVNGIIIRILELCRVPQSPENLVSALVKEYDVEEDVLREDISDIILQLCSNHILEEVEQ